MEPSDFIEFDWDHGNARKNEKHNVTQVEVEQVFRNQPLWVTEDEVHSKDERRLRALGVSDEGRRLHVTFTLRAEGRKLRPISARPMSTRERSIYEKEVKANPQI